MNSTRFVSAKNLIRVLKDLHNIKKFKLERTSKYVADIKELIKISRFSTHISASVDKVIDTSRVSTIFQGQIFS